jgi:hypothetical protein
MEWGPNPVFDRQGARCHGAGSGSAHGEQPFVYCLIRAIGVIRGSSLTEARLLYASGIKSQTMGISF